MISFNVDPPYSGRLQNRSRKSQHRLSLKLLLSSFVDMVVEELRNCRIDRNGTTGLSKVVGNIVDLDMLAS